MLVLGEALHRLHRDHIVHKVPVGVLKHLSGQVKLHKKMENIFNAILDLGKGVEGKLSRNGISIGMSHILNQIVLLLHPNIIDRFLLF